MAPTQDLALKWGAFKAAKLRAKYDLRIAAAPGMEQSGFKPIAIL